MSAYEPVGLRRFLDRAVERSAGATFLHFRGREWSYAELGAITDGAAAGLRDLGVRPGDRVAMLLPNGPEHLFLWLATVKLGAIACPVHPDLTAEEVEAVLGHLEPAALIHGLSCMAGARIGLRVSGADLADLLGSRAALRGVPEPGPDAAAEILTTSGTTGKPKAVVHIQRTSSITGEAFAHWLGLAPDDRLFTCLPLSHVNARNYSTMGAIAAGASLAIEERFSLSRFWNWMGETRATQFNAIGAMLKLLLDAPPGPSERGHRVRLVYSAPALGSQAHLAFEQRFGARLVIGYGLTESTFGFIHPLEGERDLASMGKPRRHPHPDLGNEVRLVVPGDPPRDAGPGETGEVWLRNPATCAGYFRDEELTRATLADGWLRTGDLATADANGWYTFVGRQKHLIRRRGENVSPAEVEAVLERHPAVLEAAVIGVPSPLGEEDVRAFVVLRPGASASTDDLAAFCSERLARFKVPTEWRFLECLPRTATERIAYHLLPPVG